MPLLPINNGYYSRNYRSSDLIDRLKRLGLSNAENIINSLALLVYKSNQNALDIETVKPLITEAASNLYSKNSIQYSSNKINEEVSALDSIKKIDLTEQPQFVSSDALATEEINLDELVSSSASIYDLLQVLTESSTSGLTQVLGALNVSLGAPVDKVVYNLEDRLSTKGCTAEVINTYIDLDGTQENLDAFIVDKLGYEPLIIEDVVNSVRTIPQWLENNEPQFRPATENLLLGNLYEFIVEVLYNQTGFDLDSFEEESIELKHLICSTLGLAITSTSPCIPLQPIERPIPNVVLVNAISKRAVVEAEVVEAGIRINAIAGPGEAFIHLTRSEPLTLQIQAVAQTSAQVNIDLVIPSIMKVNAVSRSRASAQITFERPTNFANLQANSGQASTSGNMYSAALYAGEDSFWFPNLFKLPYDITDATADTSQFKWVIHNSNEITLDPQGNPIARIVNDRVIHPRITFSQAYNLDSLILRLVHLNTNLIYDEVEIITRLQDLPAPNDYIELQEIIDSRYTVEGPLQHWRLPPGEPDAAEIITHNYFSWKPPQNTFHLDRYEVQAYKVGVGWETIASTTETRAQPGNQEYVLATEDYEIIVDELEQFGFLVESAEWSNSQLLRVLTKYNITWSYGKSEVFRLLDNNKGIVANSNLHFGDGIDAISISTPAEPVFNNIFSQLTTDNEQIFLSGYTEQVDSISTASDNYIFYWTRTDFTVDLDNVIVYDNVVYSTDSIMSSVEPAIFYVVNTDT